MNTIKIPSRVTLATSYAVIVVLPCVLIMLVAQLPRPAVVATFLTYAFALLPTYYLDHWLLGGIGFHSLAIFAVLAVIVAVILWPLPLLITRPTMWRSAPWRRAIWGYGVVFLALAILAAWQMTRSWGLFFG